VTVELFEGDNRDSLRALIDKGVRVHSVVCDPPYGLVSVSKRFGKDGAAPAQHGTDGAFGRFSGGFMGRQWDATFIERDPEFWKLIWEILLPGGYCIAFSGSRTGHWQAVAMEQAGFIMHPMIGWVTGQGFPKAHNAAKAIDKELGVDPEIVGSVKRRDIRNGQGEERGSNITAAALREDGPKYIDHQITKPGSPEAQQWEGWAYGTQSLKPAMEPIYVGQKPFSEKNGALNILKHGVGAINIDGCRVPTEGGRPLREVAPMRENVVYNGNSLSGRADGSLQSSKAVGSTDLGRHPANLLHDGSDEAIACFPDTGKSGVAVQRNRDGEVHNEIYGAYKKPAADDVGFADSGSAARFFNALPITELDAPIHYCPKAGKADRAGSKHPTVKPIALMRWLCRLVTPPGGTVLDPFGGSGSTAAAALAEGFNPILMEMEPEYIADIKRRFGLESPTISVEDPDIDDLLGITVARPIYDDFADLL
jgi:hypothetical protein